MTGKEPPARGGRGLLSLIPLEGALLGRLDGAQIDACRRRRSRRAAITVNAAAAPHIMVAPIAALGYALAILVGGAAVLQHRRRAASGKLAAADGIEIAPGVRMPLIFNGISQNHDLWLSRGGRGIDTAFLYGDAQQSAVGAAIASSGLPRTDVFVTGSS